MKRLREGKPEAHATEAAAYYDAPTAHTYTHGVVWNKGTQADLTRTVCTLAHVAPHTLVLDVGCGSGLSTRAVIETVLPAPACVGFDVAAAMLDIAVTTVSGAEFAMCDAGAGLPLRAGVFDSGISVSALQWLMGSGGVIDTAPFSRCMATVMSALQPGAVCAFQAYFDSPAMAEAALVTLATLGMARPTLILDFPHSNHNRKFFVRAVKPPLQPTECGDAAQRCCMSFPYISSCILCCGVSTRNFLPPHIAYVTQAHIKYAHHVLRTADYQSASGGSERGGRGSGPFKGSKLLPHDLALAHALKQALAVADPTPDKTRWSLAELTTHTHTVLAAMHTPV